MMGKTKAHAILLIFDLAAIYSIYYIFNQWQLISSNLSDFYELVEIQKPLGLYSIISILPIIHIAGFFKLSGVAARLASRGLVVLFLSMFLFAYEFDRQLENKILSAGYSYCPQKSETMRVSEFRVYVRDMSQCYSQNDNQ